MIRATKQFSAPGPFVGKSARVPSALSLKLPKFTIVGDTFCMTSDDGVQWVGNRNLANVQKVFVYNNRLYLAAKGTIHATQDGILINRMFAGSGGVNPFSFPQSFANGTVLIPQDGYYSQKLEYSKIVEIYSNPEKYLSCAVRGIYAFRGSMYGYYQSTSNSAVSWSGTYNPGSAPGLLFCSASRWGIISSVAGTPVRSTADTVPSGGSIWTDGNAIVSLPHAETSNFAYDGDTVVITTVAVGILLVSHDGGLTFSHVDTGLGKSIATIKRRNGLWLLLTKDNNESKIWSSTDLISWAHVCILPVGAGLDFEVV